MDADGILHVSAKELATGKEAAIQVKPSYGLTDDEVERMLLDSFAHAEEDVGRRQLTEQRVEADRILMATRAALAASPELLTEEDRRGHRRRPSPPLEAGPGGQRVAGHQARPSRRWIWRPNRSPSGA